MGINGEDSICSKIGSMDIVSSQPISCSHGFYQCITPIYCNVGAVKNGSSCTFAQDFSYTNYSLGIGEYCANFGYHLPSVTTIDSFVTQSLLEKLVSLHF